MMTEIKWQTTKNGTQWVFDNDRKVVNFRYFFPFSLSTLEKVAAESKGLCVYMCAQDRTKDKNVTADEVVEILAEIHCY